MKSILALVYLFNASLIPFSNYGMYYNTHEDYKKYENTTSVNFKIGFEIMDIITLYGGEKTYQSKAKGLNFIPYEQQYYCGIDCHYAFTDELKLSAGLYRQCTHPLEVWDKNSGCYDTSSLDVYIQVEGKIKLF